MQKQSYRFLHPSNKVYIITKKDYKYPLNFGFKRFYTSNLYTKDANSIIGFTDEKMCDATIKKLQFQRISKECINIENLKHLSHVMNLQSVIIITTPDLDRTDVYLYNPKNQ